MLRRLSWLFLGLGIAVGACDLNPQPEVPSLQGADSGVGGSGGFGTGLDGGGGGGAVSSGGSAGSAG
ncbi:MAG TPA: hypothetical protein PKA88_39015, partial [Polyangiaceae bacterium]|nr:hypothetical protein [Polyangiaceae bacterium]